MAVCLTFWEKQNKKKEFNEFNSIENERQIPLLLGQGWQLIIAGVQLSRKLRCWSRDSGGLDCSLMSYGGCWFESLE